MSRILINQYRRDLETRIRYGGSRNESSVRFAFATLLNGYCKPRNFILVDELTIKSHINTSIRPDGIVKDALRLDWGYWESKDEKDTIDAEIEAKLKKGYPSDNIIFEDTKTAVLIQNGQESLRIDMENDDDLDKLINQFLDYERAEVKDFRQAINNFSQDLPTILNTLRNLIDRQDPLSSQLPSPLTPLPKGEGNNRIKVKLKADKVNHKIIIDEVTTLTEIPSIVWEYKLGNRSALEWILDQYKEKKPKDKTIAEKFNNYRFADYKEQVIDLLMRVTTVSIETMKIIKQMNE